MVGDGGWPVAKAVLCKGRRERERGCGLIGVRLGLVLIFFQVECTRSPKI